jgi:hypothetical protein
MMELQGTLSDAVSIWDRLEETGLAPLSYDKEFVESFARNLKLRPGTNIREELVRTNPSVNDVLLAFIACCQPFDSMSQDIWNMFVAADAKFNEQNLQISFDFDKKKPDAIKFDLNHFKAFHEEYLWLRQRFSQPALTGAWFRGLWQAFSKWASRPVYQGEAWSDDAKNGWRPTTQETGLSLYRRVPTTGDPESDSCLRRVREALETAVGRLSSYGIRPAEGPWAFSRRRGGELEEPIPDEFTRTVAALDHDRLIMVMVTGLDYLALQLSSTDAQPEARSTVERLRDHLRLGMTEEEREEAVRHLDEFLNLPLWKSRDQLFGLWTASQIADVVGHSRITFYPINGTLRFRFAATHLATIRCEPRLHIYAELRTRAKGLVGEGRKRGIQPDWRIVGEPITDENSQAIIIECKQYAKPKSKNFLEATIDYAKNSGRSQVILINYGPLDEARMRSQVPQRLQDAWESVQGRIALIGNFKPDENEARVRFRELISALPNIDQNPIWEREGGQSLTGEWTVSLQWDAADVDLDLHLLIFSADDHPTHIYYGNTGILSTNPWCLLESDIMGGGSIAETLRGAKLLDARYQLWAHSYRGQEILRDTTKCRLQLGGQIIEVRPPNESGPVWHIGDFYGGSREIKIANIMHNRLPPVVLRPVDPVPSASPTPRR